MYSLKKTLDIIGKNEITKLQLKWVEKREKEEGDVRECTRSSSICECECTQSSQLCVSKPKQKGTVSKARDQIKRLIKHSRFTSFSDLVLLPYSPQISAAKLVKSIS